MKKVISEVTSKIDVKEIALKVAGNVQKRIATGKNADGSSMTPLKSSTIKVKQKQGGISPSTPLVFKGGTQKGINAVKVSNKEAHVISTGQASGYYGGRISSEKVLQYQSEKGRNPMEVSNSDMSDVEKLLRKQLGR